MDDIVSPSLLLRLVREALPDDVKCTLAARKLIGHCANEFVNLVVAESTDCCVREKRKRATLGPEHVVLSVTKLGFKKYGEDLEDALASCRAAAPMAKKKKPQKLTPEQALDLELEQQRLLLEDEEDHQEADE